MKVKRLLGSLAAAGTLAAFSLSFAAPAFATTTVDTNVADNQDMRSPIAVQVTANTTNLANLYQLSVQVSGPDPFSKTDTFQNSEGKTSDTITWDLGTARHNGVYRLTSSAQEQSLLGPGNVTPGPSRTVNVNIPPAIPTGVAAALDSGNVPVVTWNPNPEPDIKEFEVFRSGDASSAAAFTTNGTSFRDTGAPQGKALSYIVVAVRPSPLWQSGITSCNGAAPCANPPTAQATRAVTVPVPPPPAPAAQTAPKSIATVDPPPAPKATAGSGSKAPTIPPIKAAIGFGSTALQTLDGPTIPPKIVQLPAPNVIQFAPLLPYSGKVPEIATTQTVPAPVQAQTADAPQVQETLALPGGVRVTRVDAVKYVATAAFLLIAAVHLTRFARKLKTAAI